jgi:hypothetical protein
MSGISYLTHTQYVSMALSRLLPNYDSLVYLMKIWKKAEAKWTIEWYSFMRQHISDFIDLKQIYDIQFDIGHFYPKFLSIYNPVEYMYQNMSIREKINLIKHLNTDKQTYQMRRKSMYLFIRNHVDHLPDDTLVFPNCPTYNIGVMGYTGLPRLKD